MKCLVTGATGFIGSQLCQSLLVHGHEVAALSHSGRSLSGGVKTRPLDLAQQEPPGEIFDGVDAVFHLAAIAHRQAPADIYERLNHQATVQLARGAAAAGVKCFIFLGSVKAMGPAVGDRVRSEEDVGSVKDAYGRSKWLAECDLRREFEHSPMSVVILRPALVYGPGARGNLRLLAAAVQRGLPRPPPGGARSMVSVGDLVELMHTVAQDPPAGIHTWIVTDGGHYTTREIYDLLRRALGKSEGRAWLPRWVWRLGAALLDILARGDSMPAYERLFGSELYSNEAVIRDTAWRPRQRLDRAAAATLLAAPKAGH